MNVCFMSSLPDLTLQSIFLLSLPMNLSTDVLKMLRQQQSRQTELNHYVRQVNITRCVYFLQHFRSKLYRTLLCFHKAAKEITKRHK
jgi:hypothetical protein